MKSVLLFLTSCFLSFGAFCQIPGNLDPSFNPGSGADNWINYIDSYPGSRLIIGGDFLHYDGLAINRLARIHSDGTIDNTFQPGTGANGAIWALAVSPDGKIIIGGNFTSYNGISRNRIARINGDGSLDNSFNPGSGANDWVRCVLLQPDGKIVIAGEFLTFNGLNRSYITRLNSDGSLDNQFLYTTNLNAKAHKGILAPDGKILIGGDFSSYGGTTVSKMCRLNQDGTLDQTFTASPGASHQVRDFAVQPDGKILIGGYFLSVNGQPRNRLARLFDNGSLDPGFYASPVQVSPVYTLALQPNGKTFVMGSFTNLDNKGYNFIAQILSDGKVDTSFKTGSGPNNGALTYVFMPDGRVYIAGNFTSYNGVSRNRIARIFGDSIPQNQATKNLITGSVFTNSNNDCSPDAGETLLPNRFVRAEPGSFWGNMLNSGKYKIFADTGAYVVSLIRTPIEQLFENQICPPGNQGHAVSFGSSIGDTIEDVNFAVNVVSCPILSVEIGSNRRRRCFRNQTVLSLSNAGNATAYQVVAHLKMPNFVVLVSADRPFTFNSVDSTFEFVVDSIVAGHGLSIHIVDSVKCIAGIMGVEQCTKVWLTPGNTCIPTPGWDGVDLVLSALCKNNLPTFTLKNVGSPMSASHDYQVFVDSALVYSHAFILNGGDSLVFSIPNISPTSVIRVEAPQSAHHPFSSFVTASISCGLPTFGASISAQSDEDPVVAIHCLLIRDSYDPNEKRVYPTGLGTEGRVIPNRYFDYKIHFQNTGTDTAYKVVIIDTLDSDLDMSTFEHGASSHKYQFSVSGQGRPVLKWILNNIMLPDSFTNSLGSNGFISYRIKPISGSAVGTEIENSASIIFDFNEPIKTNTTLNTLYIPVVVPGIVDSVVVINGVNSQIVEDYTVRLYPNPGHSKVLVSSENPIEVRVFSITGKEVFFIKERKKEHQLNFVTYSKGLYYVVAQEAGRKSVHKLIIE